MAVGACDEASTILFNPPPPRDPCAGCRTVVSDIEKQLALLAKPTRADVGDIVEHMCDNMGLRHEHPAFVESVCEEMLDELQVGAPINHPSPVTR